MRSRVIFASNFVVSKTFLFLGGGVKQYSINVILVDFEFTALTVWPDPIIKIKTRTRIVWESLSTRRNSFLRFLLINNTNYQTGVKRQPSTQIKLSIWFLQVGNSDPRDFCRILSFYFLSFFYSLLHLLLSRISPCGPWTQLPCRALR